MPVSLLAKRTAALLVAGLESNSHLESVLLQYDGDIAMIIHACMTRCSQLDQIVLSGTDDSRKSVSYRSGVRDANSAAG